MRHCICWLYTQDGSSSVVLWIIGVGSDQLIDGRLCVMIPGHVILACIACEAA